MTWTPAGSDRRPRHHRGQPPVAAVANRPVLQDTWLFAGTIAENIAFGRPDATGAEIAAAARVAYVDQFARSLPEGLDTRSGRRRHHQRR